MLQFRKIPTTNTNISRLKCKYVPSRWILLFSSSFSWFYSFFFACLAFLSFVCLVFSFLCLFCMFSFFVCFLCLLSFLFQYFFRLLSLFSLFLHASFFFASFACLVFFARLAHQFPHFSLHIETFLLSPKSPATSRCITNSRYHYYFVYHGSFQQKRIFSSLSLSHSLKYSYYSFRHPSISCLR